MQLVAARTETDVYRRIFDRHGGHDMAHPMRSTQPVLAYSEYRHTHEHNSSIRKDATLPGPPSSCASPDGIWCVLSPTAKDGAAGANRPTQQSVKQRLASALEQYFGPSEEAATALASLFTSASPAKGNGSPSTREARPAQTPEPVPEHALTPAPALEPMALLEAIHVLARESRAAAVESHAAAEASRAAVEGQRNEMCQLRKEWAMHKVATRMPTGHLREAAAEKERRLAELKSEQATPSAEPRCRCEAGIGACCSVDLSGATSDALSDVQHPSRTDGCPPSPRNDDCPPPPTKEDVSAVVGAATEGLPAVMPAAAGTADLNEFTRSSSQTGSRRVEFGDEAARRVVLAVLSEKTGFFAESIELEMELHADLQIGSGGPFAKGDCLNEVLQRLNITAPLDFPRMQQATTVGALIDVMVAELGSKSPRASPNGSLKNVTQATRPSPRLHAAGLK